MNGTRKFLCALWGLILCGMWPAVAQQSHMEIIRDDVVGVVLMPDGLTPVEKLPIRVWSMDRNRMIYRTRTDENGVFRLPPLRTENCEILAGRVRVGLAMARKEEGLFYQQHDIIMVLPRPPVTISSGQIAEMAFAPAMLQLPEIFNPPDPPPVVSP